VGQCLLATVAIIVTLMLMDVVAHTALIASLGASTFIAFTMPRANVSNPRYLVGGYVIGVLFGVLFGLLSAHVAAGKSETVQHVCQILFGGVAVGLAIFGMVVTNCEHPPAAGVALGLVIGSWDVWTLVAILGSITALAILRTVLRRFMRNLL
jgi:CBS-domain-containing membrane protein